MFDQRELGFWPMKTKSVFIYKDGSSSSSDIEFQDRNDNPAVAKNSDIEFAFGNYQDYGYGIFLLDDKSRDYILKNIQNEKDDFLRSMMWGALWDSVREAELDPKEYVELTIKVLSPAFTRPASRTQSAARSESKPPKGGTQNFLKNSREGGTQNEDESTTSAISRESQPR
jgi:aminopeptidase N